jgi:HEAT repeat protein
VIPAVVLLAAGGYPASETSSAPSGVKPLRQIASGTDLLSVDATIRILPRTRQIRAIATLTFVVETAADSVHLLAGPLSIRRVELAGPDSVFASSSFVRGSGDSISVTLTETADPGDTMKVRLDYEAGIEAGLRASALPGREDIFWTVSWPHLWRHILPGGANASDAALVDLFVTADTSWSVIGWPRSETDSSEDSDLRTTRIWSNDEVDIRQVGFVAGPFTTVDDTISPAGDHIRIRYALSQPVDRLTAMLAAVPEIAAFMRFQLALDFPDTDLVVSPISEVDTDPISSAHGVIARPLDPVVDPDSESEVLLKLARIVSYGWMSSVGRPGSWEDCWLQDGLADYMALLFLEADAGVEAFSEQLFAAREAYLASVDATTHPLVRPRWDHPLSQNEPAIRARTTWMLHEFRVEYGVEAFWDVLRAFLMTPGAGTADDFIRAAETVLGASSTPFLERRFFRSGHPEIQVAVDFVREDRKIRLTAEQVQKGSLIPDVFRLILGVEIHTLTGVSTEHLHLQDRLGSFEFDSEFRPRAIVLDPEGKTLSDIIVDQDPSAVVFQIRESESVFARLNAARSARGLTKDRDLLVGLGNLRGRESRVSVRSAVAEAIAAHFDSLAARGYLLDLLSDSSGQVRAAAAQGLSRFAFDPVVYRALLPLAHGDTNIHAQSAAVLSLIRGGYPERDRLHQAALITDSPGDRIRAAAVDAAVYMDWPESRAVTFALEHVGPNRHTRVRLAAIRLLARFRDRRTVPALVSLLTDPSVAVRRAAANSLQAAVDSSDRNRVTNALARPNVPEVEYAAAAMPVASGRR